MEELLSLVKKLFKEENKEEILKEVESCITNNNIDVNKKEKIFGCILHKKFKGSYYHYEGPIFVKNPNAFRYISDDDSFGEYIEWSFFQYICACGKKELVELLLKKFNADKTIKDSTGRDSIEIAKFCKHEETLKILEN
jgi:hypothetical protein